MLGDKDKILTASKKRVILLWKCLYGSPGLTANDSTVEVKPALKAELKEGPGKEELISARTLFGWSCALLSGFTCLFLALSAVHITSPGLQVGDIASQDIVAQGNFSVIDKIATEKVVEKARQAIIPVFQVDKSRDLESLEAIKESLNRVDKLHAAGILPLAAEAQTSKAVKPAKASKPSKVSKKQTPPPATSLDMNPAIQTAILRATEADMLKLTADLSPSAIAKLKEERKALASTGSDISDEELLTAVSVSPKQMDGFRKVTSETAERLVRKFPRYPVNDKTIWQEIVVEFLPENLPAQMRTAASLLLAKKLEANLVIEPDATRQKAEQVVKTVEPVKQEIKEGQVIVPRGALITADKLLILQEMGITHVNRWPFVLSMGISLVAALTLIGLFLYTYEPKLFFSPNAIGLMFTVQVVACAVASLFGKTYPAFVPIPASALVLTIFFGKRTALALTLPLLLLVAVDRLMEVHNLSAHLLASMGAIWAYSKQRNAVFSTTICIALGLVLGDLLANVFDQSLSDWAILSKHLAMDLVGGLVSSIVAIGCLPFLENIYGLITPFRLAELTDANQPLLRRLEENAPGTYQHSLAVANLAEAGAKAIFADANLVRAGALYHDIGKMVRPKYFIENQLGATNPHDSMSPEDSRARVLAHVTDGIALAQKYSLPKAIQDFVPMHQGTTLMAYFYHKACLRDGVENVDANFYRYPGPRPNTRETAIVMLADVSEAVTHSMRDPSQEEVEETLEKVFQNRWDDGQFALSGLTMEEMHKVRAAFARVWRTLHHERLKYPASSTGKMPIAPETQVPVRAEPKPDDGTPRESISGDILPTLDKPEGEKADCDCEVNVAQEIAEIKKD